MSIQGALVRSTAWLCCTIIICYKRFMLKYRIHQTNPSPYQGAPGCRQVLRCFPMNHQTPTLSDSIEFQHWKVSNQCCWKKEDNCLACHSGMSRCSLSFSMSATKSQVVFCSKQAWGVLLPAPLCNQTTTQIKDNTQPPFWLWLKKMTRVTKMTWSNRTIL